jgi:uncharacterized membrane protein
MFQKIRSPRRRALRPSLDALEGRALLNAAPLHHGPHARVAAHVFDAQPASQQMSMTQGPTITSLNTAMAGGFNFANFDLPGGGTGGGQGTNANGIANSGTPVGFSISATGSFNNFIANPLRTKAAKLLNINGSTTAMAFGVNSAGTVVGTDGNGNAFFFSRGKVNTFIPTGGTSATAFGINDRGEIVGQYVTATATPGFVRINGKSLITINVPSGPNTVNAQGINNKGLVVGFYVGMDGQDHGFMANTKNLKGGTLTGTALADPVIPSVPGEPGATFVFSQILAVNDKGIAVGYYGDSTTSQHGFIYNTRTGQYTFLDDPSEAFNNGVEVTQITGITNSGEITGFYSDANGVFHGFVATTHGH